MRAATAGRELGRQSAASRLAGRRATASSSWHRPLRRRRMDAFVLEFPPGRAQGWWSAHEGEEFFTCWKAPSIPVSARRGVARAGDAGLQSTRACRTSAAKERTEPSRLLMVTTPARGRRLCWHRAALADAQRPNTNSRIIECQKESDNEHSMSSAPDRRSQHRGFASGRAEWRRCASTATQARCSSNPGRSGPTVAESGFRASTRPDLAYPLHRHDLRRSEYIMEGESRIRARYLRAGTRFTNSDPHYEDEMHTHPDGVWLLVQ
jgi:hypothetical protein